MHEMRRNREIPESRDSDNNGQGYRDQRVAGVECTQQRSAGQNVPEVRLYHGGRHAVVSRANRKRPEQLPPARLGGWGGRYVFRTPRGEAHAIWTQGGDLFSRVTSQDSVRGADDREVTSGQATIWRWREAYQHDFAARMDWTVADFQHANHNPVVTVNGEKGTAPLVIEAEVGRPVTLDASESRDPDRQRLNFRWLHYAEAGTTGTHAAAVTLAGADTAKAVVTPAAACRPVWLPAVGRCSGTDTAHLILEVTAEGTPRLTSYRRIILNVRAAGVSPPAAASRKPPGRER